VLVNVCVLCVVLNVLPFRFDVYEYISYYNFTSDTNDGVGTNHLTNDGATATTSGKVGGAYTFDGSNDYMYKNSPSSLPSGSSARSISLWFNRTSGASSSMILGYNGASGAEVRIYDFIGAGDYIFGDGINVGNNMNYTTFWTDNNWTHIVFVITDSTHYKLYRNGVDVTASTNLGGTFGTAINTASPTYLAVGKLLPSNFLKGVVDEIGIWSRALNSTEVTQLYNSGTGVSYPFVTNITYNVSFYSQSPTNITDTTLFSQNINININNTIRQRTTTIRITSQRKNKSQTTNNN